MAKLVGAPRLS